MPITVVCCCGKTFPIPDAMGGRKIRCMSCRAVIVVPGSSPEPEEADPELPSRAPFSIAPASFASPQGEDANSQHAEESTKPEDGWWQWLAVASALFVVLLLAAGGTIYYLQRVVEPPPPAPKLAAAKNAMEFLPSLTTEQVVAKAEASVCRVHGEFSAGTGFVVFPGIVATNAHVVRGQPEASLRVMFPGAGEGKTTTIVGYDEARDLAFLKVADTPPPLVIAPPGPFRRGQEVVIIGNPGALGVTLENAISRGVLSTQVTIGGMEFEQLGASINPGNSGGPVLDMNGQVLGVATLKAKQEGVGFCVPRDALRRQAVEALKATPASVALAQEAQGKTIESSVPPEFVEELKRASPARKLAMLETFELIPEGHPLVATFRRQLDLANDIYIQDQDEIARIMCYVMWSLGKEGKSARPSEILQCLVETPPPNIPGAPKYECTDFSTNYLMFRMKNGDHEVAMRLMREVSAAIEQGMVKSYPQFAVKPPSRTVSSQHTQDNRGANRAPVAAITLGPWLSCTATSQIDAKRTASPDPPFEERAGAARFLTGARVSARQVQLADGSLRWLVRGTSTRVVLIYEAEASSSLKFDVDRAAKKKRQR